MSFIVVDVEADGPIPGKYSMVCFGAVIVRESGLNTTFYGKVKPISEDYIPDSLKVSGFSREEHLAFDDPKGVMTRFKNWILANSRGPAIFVSDNIAFDWQFINYYMHIYLGENPFGHSGRRIGDLYCGLVKDASLNYEWKKKYRKTKHNHHPVNDAKSNAEAMIAFKQELGLNIKFN